MASNKVPEDCRQSYASIAAGKAAVRTVGQDDELTQRGANPRTGLVTPFVTTAGSLNTANDYLKAKIRDPRQRYRSHGRWKQDDLSWSFTDSPLPSPVAQSANVFCCVASIKSLQDKFVVDMPGVDDPEPRQMTMKEIKEYQKGIEKNYRGCCEEQAVNDSNLAPIQNMSPNVTKKGSDRRASPLEWDSAVRRSRPKDGRRLLRARILDESTENPFMGGLHSTTPAVQPTRLSQFLPKIELLHPSHFSNSYRRPANLSPPYPQRSKPSADHFSATPSQPKVRRNNEAVKVPRVGPDQCFSDLDTNGQHAHERSTVLREEISTGVELNKVRARLQPSQTCKCSRCLDMNNAPASFAVSGNILRETRSSVKNEHTEDKNFNNASSETRSEIETSDLSHGSAPQTSGLRRSKSLIRRVEKITTLLDTMQTLGLIWTQHCLSKVLQHVLLTFYHALPASRVLKRADAMVEEYVVAVRQMLIAAVYLVISVKVVITVVKVVGMLLNIIWTISWPARAVGAVVRWLLLG
ncbi:MAG: hypothetical protein Q9195_001301 [Heterodermia aff. obscurata]